MDKLKDFIDKNREAFDTDDLPVGDLDRFLGKMEQAEDLRSKRRWLRWVTVPIAAAIALLLYWALPLGENTSDEAQYVCELHSEMAELGRKKPTVGLSGSPQIVGGWATYPKYLSAI